MKPDAYYRNGEDLNFVPSTHDEERALFASAKAGDADAKEKLIHDHLLLVANIARRLSKGRLPEDEVISAANFALVKAFENFKPEFPNRFAAFLKLHVRGEIARLWHDKNIVSKDDFSDGEAITSVPIVENSDEDTSVEDKDHHRFLVTLLKQSLDVLDTREKLIMELMFSETPCSQSDVARRFKLTRERVRQLYDAAMAKLRKEMRRKMNESGVNQ